MRNGLLACLFGLLGVFTLAVLFVPIAVIFAGAGLIGSLLRNRGDALLVNLVAVGVIYWAILVSPSLWFLIGMSVQ